MDYNRTAKMKSIILILLNLCFVIGFSLVQAQTPKREFRAVWMATVKNIDWPSVPGLSTEEQKNEYRNTLDYHQLNGINAVIMQVRPSADAFYKSKLEPWSRYLTGVSGQAPDSFYDPLTFMIDEAHDRGMEFHAWFNPYRAIVDMEEFPEDSTNMFYQKPEWFVEYGSRMYFDPGIPEVQTYTTEIIKDVVERYDIDAIHFDDYFYPYRIAGVEFPDSVSFENHGGDYNAEFKDDWRRQNVNTVIQMLSDTIKSVKPWVKFGISPFGVWRNIADDVRGSDSEAGQTNYDDLFADVLLWMDSGWIDYILPQLYLHIGHPKLDFEKVLHWWNDLDYDGHLYAGHAVYRAGNVNEDSVWMNPSEIPDQIRMTRKMSDVLGGAHFSSKSFAQNILGISDSLRTDLYATKALIPTMPWLDDEAPVSPSGLIIQNEPDGVFLEWNSNDTTSKYYAIYRFEGKKIGDFENGANIQAIQRANTAFYKDRAVRKRKKYTYAITAIDRLYNESEPTAVRFIKVTKKNKK